MHRRTAHSACAIARWIHSTTAALLIAVPAVCQAPSAVRRVEPSLVELLHHRDPVLRGEAAMALAHGGGPAHYADLQTVAADRKREARLRGILALGILAAPGAESYLSDLLRRTHWRDPERAAAALALGLIPADASEGAIRSFLRRVGESSYRRHRGAIAALLLGIGEAPDAAHDAALRGLIGDRSNREPELRRLALRALRHPSADEALHWLDSRHESERLGALEALAGFTELREQETERIRTAALGDRSAAVRATALRLLSAHRHPDGLELARQALLRPHPREVAAAVATTRRLAGGEIRSQMEAQILRTPRAELQAAMLAAYDLPASRGFAETCLELAADERAPHLVRVYAATVAARSEDRRAGSTLRELFFESTGGDELRALARATRDLDHALLDLDRVFPPASTRDAELLPPRIEALLAVQYPGAVEALASAMASPTVDDNTRRALVVGLRRTLAPRLPADLLELLPQELRHTLLGADEGS